jgi:hypothetical protein
MPVVSIVKHYKSELRCCSLFAPVSYVERQPLLKKTDRQNSVRQKASQRLLIHNQKNPPLKTACQNATDERHNLKKFIQKKFNKIKKISAHLWTATQTIHFCF